MKTFARDIIDRDGDRSHPIVEPEDAATLIVLDLSNAAAPTVLMGRRHSDHVFLPNKIVFPGGGVDPSDQLMPAAKPLDPHTERKLTIATTTEYTPTALALAAIRELFEEAGLVIGVREPSAGNVPEGSWTAFARTGYCPDLSALRFIARAITPPGFPRRFDARFFCADVARAAPDQAARPSTASAELLDLAWVSLADAVHLNLPTITQIVIRELQDRLAVGLEGDAPVPFFHMRDGEFTQDLL